MEMTPKRWENTCAYLRDVFGTQDEHLGGLMERAVAAGLPSIAVSADVGRLLMLLTSMTGDGRGAKVAVELGTLAGYSAIWIARGLSPGGRLITVEPNGLHADFAAGEFRRAGVAGSIEIRRAPALDAIPRIAAELGPASIDVAFLDAVKTEYPAYLAALKPLIRPGGLLIADNALGSSFWIDDPPGSSPERDAVDRFNRLVASDRDFVTACVPIREGVLIARKVL
ncbi:MAG: O-methyltransferase [Phycisphaerales bacterium]